MARTSQIQPVVHNSLGFQALCRNIQESAVCDILELGPVRNANLDFWSRFSPSIFIADLRSSLPLPISSPDEEESREPDWQSILNLPEERSYSVILAWDLLNYLDISAVASLIRYLGRFCRPGALLFALIYDQKQMPEQITVYRVVDESHLAYENSSEEMRACPRHQPRALSGVMSGFQASESFRLRNGVVEYLYAFEGENPGGTAL